MMSSVWFTACLAMASAKAGLLAMRPAMASTVASRSARGTTWFTMPRRCASWALQLSAVKRNSLALRAPSSHGCTNHSTPSTPMVTTGSQNSASSLAMMMSQAQASISPPAMQRPCTAAMVGLGRLRQRRVFCR